MVPQWPFHTQKPLEKFCLPRSGHVLKLRGLTALFMRWSKDFARSPKARSLDNYSLFQGSIQTADFQYFWLWIKPMQHMNILNDKKAKEWIDDSRMNKLPTQRVQLWYISKVMSYKSKCLWKDKIIQPTCPAQASAQQAAHTHPAAKGQSVSLTTRPQPHRRPIKCQLTGCRYKEHDNQSQDLCLICSTSLCRLMSFVSSAVAVHSSNWLYCGLQM